MSDKDRRKKDGERKDKKNERMREATASRVAGSRSARDREKHEAKMTDTIPDGAARMRKHSG
jgi:hypothetical protein